MRRAVRRESTSVMGYLRERELSPTRRRIPCYLVELEAPVLNRDMSLCPRPGWYHKVLLYQLCARCCSCQAEMPFDLNPDSCFDNNGARIEASDPVDPKYHRWLPCSGGCMAVFKVIISERGGRDLTPENNTTPVFKLQVVGDFILLPAFHNTFIDTLWHYTRPAVHHPNGEVTPPRRVRPIELDNNNALVTDNQETRIRLTVRIHLIQYIDKQFAGLLEERQIEALPGTLFDDGIPSPNASNYEDAHDYNNFMDDSDGGDSDDDDDDDDNNYHDGEGSGGNDGSDVDNDGDEAEDSEDSEEHDENASEQEQTDEGNAGDEEEDAEGNSGDEEKDDKDCDRFRFGKWFKELDYYDY